MNIRYLLGGEFEDIDLLDFDVATASKMLLASYRLRGGLMGSGLEALGCGPIRFGAAPHIQTESDLIVLKIPYTQATLTRWRQHLEARATAGTRIWLDICDLPSAKPERLDFYLSIKSMVKGAFAPSEWLAASIRQELGFACKVVPDPLEYSTHAYRPLREKPNQILWFGHPLNLDHLIAWLPAIYQVNPAAVVYVLSEQKLAADYLIQQKAARPGQLWPELKVKAWSRQQMLALGEQCDLCVLPGGWDDPVKMGVSDHRLISSLTLGMPTVASPCASYWEWSELAVLSEDFESGIDMLLERDASSSDRVSATITAINQRRGTQALASLVKDCLTSTEEPIDAKQIFSSVLKGAVQRPAQELIQPLIGLISSQAEQHYAHYLLGTLYLQQGVLGLATKHLNLAYRLNPDHANYAANLAVALESGAYISLAAQTLQPLYQDGEASLAVLQNLGNAKLKLGQAAQAAEIFDEGLRRYPPSEGLHNGRAYAHILAGKPGEALPDYEQAVALKPESPANRFCLATTLLQLGNFERGWPLYESRWELQSAPKRPSVAPLWDGKKVLRGKTVLVHSEQGFGDTMQFSRYVRVLVEETGAKVVFWVQPSLEALMKASFPEVEVFAGSAFFRPADYQIALMSLPQYFTRSPADIPSVRPYLSPTAKSSANWNHRMRELAGNSAERVGICWFGHSREHHETAKRIDKRRSLSPKQVIEKLALTQFSPNVQFFSLQHDYPNASHRNLLKGEGLISPIKDVSDALRSFDDTAALIEQLDRVITVDTAIAHLSGALGVCTEIIHRTDRCWRWGTESKPHRWYRGVRG